MIISTFILRRSYDTVVLLFLPDMMAFYEPIFITQYLQVVLLLCYLFTKHERTGNIATFHWQRFPRLNNTYMWTTFDLTSLLRQVTQKTDKKRFK